MGTPVTNAYLDTDAFGGHNAEVALDGPSRDYRRRVLPVGLNCCHSFTRSHFHHRRLAGDYNHARRTRSQFVINFFLSGAVVLDGYLEQNLVPERQKLYQVRLGPLLLDSSFTLLREAFSQADLLPPSSLGSLHGYPTFYLFSDEWKDSN